MEDFADIVAKLCIEKYMRLSKNGKPSEKEWTVLSGIVLKKHDDSLSLVALATGTKCLGELDLINTEMYEEGCRLNDSHAEVLARRAFLRYLYEEIDLLFCSARSNIFTLNEKKQISLHNGVSFHFFTSQTPCGDCSIFRKDEFHEHDAPPNKIKKYDCNDTGDVIVEYSKNKQEEQNIKDIHRTGAKCIKTDRYQDSHLPGVNYHVTGPLRTKPGRGNPTLSLSCSDKMAKWNILGLQGALLSMLIPPIKMETVVVGGGCPFSLEAMNRGLYKRFNKNMYKLKVMQAQVSFKQQKSHNKKHPCPSSIIWSAVRHRDTEVAVEGRKQGATKRKKGSNLRITRRALFEVFLKTCDKYQHSDCNIRHPKKITYLDCKKWSKSYQNLWNTLKSESFHAWNSKPTSLQTFVL
ncbi:PREDICTED: tRNA-specific adenosine deaminase 1 [Dufourea novaeangliae]|uniref:tRNA-specific adenosine deaminase 1 n=1 Tax=Dufourea novaeangliae TaxID=178035 RepID=UPI000766FAA2|nr:PREDICTED: tRNA-specific adenosine deaminase 1 [Dufourea novaeangliae]